MTDQQSKSNEDAQVPTEGLGAQLRQARESKKLTQQDVSNSLRYSVKQIDALENHQFEVLPDAMMTRGFIRSYAKYLDMDAEFLLADYRARLGEEDAHKVIIVKSSMRPVALTKESLPWLKYILATIVVLLFLLAWMFYVEFMPKQTLGADSDTVNVAATDVAGADSSAEVGQTQQNAETSTAITAVPEAALPAAERLTEADASQAIQDITANQITMPSTPSAVADASTNVAPGTRTATEADAVQPNAKKTIHLSFTGQSWVSVSDKNGKVIYEKLGQAGTQESVSAMPPLTVVIGNAVDTKLQYSGQPVDITANTRNNVARITLE